MQLHKYEIIDSTNLEAIRLIKAGKLDANQNHIIIAKSQTAGKGRLGRKWVSDEGNLFVSLIYKNITPTLLHLRTCLAIGNSLGRVNIEYKWPNDVLISGQKIAGVLIEIFQNYTIIGIGINVSSHPEEGVLYPTTCLNKHRKTAVNIDMLLRRLVIKLENLLQHDDKKILTSWIKKAYLLHQNITINQENHTISGIFKGVDKNGCLILLQDKDKKQLVSFGDVV